MTTRFFLPFPPPLNNLFAQVGNRRVVARNYKDWRIRAAAALIRQRPIPKFAGKVAVVYAFGRPDKRKRDLGNLEKVVSDLLVDHGIIGDDSLIERIELAWAEGVEGVRVEIAAVAGEAAT